ADRQSGALRLGAIYDQARRTRSRGGRLEGRGRADRDLLSLQPSSPDRLPRLSDRSRRAAGRRGAGEAGLEPALPPLSPGSDPGLHYRSAEDRNGLRLSARFLGIERLSSREELFSPSFA